MTNRIAQQEDGRVRTAFEILGQIGDGERIPVVSLTTLLAGIPVGSGEEPKLLASVVEDVRFGSSQPRGIVLRDKETQADVWLIVPVGQVS